jgi:hypothetical protein
MYKKIFVKGYSEGSVFYAQLPHSSLLESPIDLASGEIYKWSRVSKEGSVL